jgi:hypothetical protein
MVTHSRTTPPSSNQPWCAAEIARANTPRISVQNRYRRGERRCHHDRMSGDITKSTRFCYRFSPIQVRPTARMNLRVIRRFLFASYPPARVDSAWTFAHRCSRRSCSDSEQLYEFKPNDNGAHHDPRRLCSHVSSVRPNRRHLSRNLEAVDRSR